MRKKERGQPAGGTRSIEREQDWVESGIEEERKRANHNDYLERHDEGKDDGAICTDAIDVAFCVRTID